MRQKLQKSNLLMIEIIMRCAQRGTALPPTPDSEEDIVVQCFHDAE